MSAGAKLTGLFATVTAWPLWRISLVAWLAGGLAALSLPPYDIWPVLFVSYTTLVWLLDSAVRSRAGTRRRFVAGFAVGWCFAVGYFVPSLWWISEAFWLEPEKFAALIPFAVAGLPAYLSLYWGLAVGAAAILWIAGWPRVVLLAGLVGAGEWLRGHLLTGFPWNLPGYGAGSLEGFSQIASLVGIYGMTVLVILTAATPAAFLDAGRSGNNLPGRAAFPAIIAAGMIALHLWGNNRIASYDAALDSSGDGAIPVRIIQPNISQKDKWDPKHAKRIIETYLYLTGSPFADPPSLPLIVVWPESALPRLIGEEDALRAMVMAVMPPQSRLLTGSLHRVIDDTGKAAIFNSLLAIPSDGQIAGRHDKVRLVPFGEFLPFQWLLEPLGLRQIVNLPRGFSAGLEDKVIKLEGLPAFAGFICYEAVFPRSRPYASRPEMLVNVTNDAWFGHSNAPYQHFSHLVLRAIENRVAIVRSANTGISGWIDPLGRIRAATPIFEPAAATYALKTSDARTPYDALGDFVGLLSLAATLALVGSDWWTHRTQRSRQA